MGFSGFFAAFAITLFSAGVSAADIELVAGPAGRQVVAATGDVLIVRVVGNASTGYAWERIDDGRGVLVQVRGAVTPAPQAERPVIGGPTTQVWRFRAEKAGDSTLRFVYRQPWRKDVEPTRELAWHIVVR